MGTFVYLAFIAAVSLVVLAHPAVAQGANTTPPLTYRGQVLQSVDNQTCPSEEHQEMARKEIKTTMRRLLRDSIVPDLQSYTFVCGGSTGWKRVAYLNMSEPSQECPSVWKEITTPHRVCGRTSTWASCEGLTYTTGSEQYDQVCGRIIGYQIGTPDAFAFTRQLIDSYYMDGISVTHGSPHHHIWSFVGGVNEVTTYPASACPCVTGSTSRTHIPSFVGQNYFCETGITWMAISIQMVTPCGMDRGVVPLAPVAPSTHHRGSMCNCLLPQLMTLRSESVVAKGLEMKILQYNSWNSM